MDGGTKGHDPGGTPVDPPHFLFSRLSIASIKEVVKPKFLVRIVKLLCYYIFFYAALLGICVVMYLIFIKSLPAKVPKLRCCAHDGQPILRFPGLAILGIDKVTEYRKDSFQTITYGDDEFKSSVAELNKHVNAYITDDITTERLENCNGGETQACLLNREYIGECADDKYHGFKKNKPCIFLKVNRIHNWVPTKFTESELKSKVPKALRDYTGTHLPIGCEPKKSLATEYVMLSKGDLTIFPEKGVSKKCFPYCGNYRNSTRALSPLVAIQLDLTDKKYIKKHVYLECQLYAGNTVNFKRKTSRIRFAVRRMG